MDAGIISTRYARAIYEYAAEKGKEMDLYEGMRFLATKFSQFPTLREIMRDPTLTAEQKIEVLTTAAGAHANENLQQVIRLVIRNRRSNYMENIALMYDQVYRKAKGIVIVQLTTIEPAGEKMKESLISVVAQVTGEKVEFQAKTDSDIIGGFILEVEDKRLDASVREQLRMINYEL
jgi:F-type H+-transporting ATPase subunit delta